MCPTEQPPAEREARRPNQEQHNTFYDRLKREIQNPRFAVELVGLGVLIIYTSCTLYQSCKIRQSTDATKESADAAVASARAWIAVKEISSPSPEVKLPWVVQLLNAGKTPALEIESTEEVRLWQNGTPFPQFKTCPSTNRARIAVFRAGEPFSLNPPLNFTINDEQIAALKNNRARLMIHGCLKYRNVGSMGFGLTEFCGVSFGPGVYMCPTNNRLE